MQTILCIRMNLMSLYRKNVIMSKYKSISFYFSVNFEIFIKYAVFFSCCKLHTSTLVFTKNRTGILQIKRMSVLFLSVHFQFRSYMLVISNDCIHLSFTAGWKISFDRILHCSCRIPILQCFLTVKIIRKKSV